jgi:hypothetical protein
MRESKTSIQTAIARPSRSTAGSLIRDPALFARLVLGADLWQTQREILTAVSQHSRVAVKACHASGKSLRDSDRCALVVNRASRWNRGDHGADLAAGGKSYLG